MSKIITPSKLLVPVPVSVPHHTVGDWDKSTATWELDTDLYISPPSSLDIWGAGNKCFLCRLPGSLNLPDGRVITWFHLAWKDNFILTFRNQATLGSANLSNTYLIQDTALNYIGLAKIVNDVYTLVGQVWWDKDLYTWYRGRFTWWTTYDEQNTPSLAVHFELEVAGEWVDLGIIHDTNNLWHDSDTNRCGPATSTGYVHFDDTEIWKPEE